ncbi:MAG: hypothetical protein OXC14_17150, partial [Rhodospirillaceae bacterium]|nr:hypothetical protein [Rhodospirillaceae bacterium]
MPNTRQTWGSTLVPCLGRTLLLLGFDRDAHVLSSGEVVLSVSLLPAKMRCPRGAKAERCFEKEEYQVRIRSLHFDVFGTVVDWRESVAREAAAILDGRGVECDWHAFADAWRSRYQPAMEEVRSGRRGWVKLDELHRENLETVLDEFEMPGIDAGDFGRLNLAWHRLDPWPDVPAGLARLRRGY